MEESEPSDYFLEALREVTYRLSSIDVHVEEIQSELDEKHCALQVAAQVAASRIRMQANAAFGSQDQACINAALVNIERRKRTYLKLKRAKVSAMRRLQIDIEDYHKATLNDLLLKLEIGTMMETLQVVFSNFVSQSKAIQYIPKLRLLQSQQGL